jgi:hypothetical protein
VDHFLKPPGHEETTVAAGYGEGFPVPLLKQWIDKIGTHPVKAALRI